MAAELELKKQEEDSALTAEENDAKALVEDLYTYNQRYYLMNDTNDPNVKDTDIRKKMDDTVGKLKLQEDDLPRPFYQYLCGKALNVTTSYSQEAEQMLSQSVKQDPMLIDAWNCLGESYWKQGNVQQAYNCFLRGLSHKKNKVSLRNLSMVLRQLGTNAEERKAKLTESLDKAKESVSMDVKDGVSWMVLGNAYLALFFSSNQDYRLLQQCSNAYSQAEKDSVVACNPDLHFNKATLLLFEEEYNVAIHHLEQACKFDPGWPTPRQKLMVLKGFLQSFSRSVSSRGKLKPKRLSIIQESLTQREKWIGKNMGSAQDLSIEVLRKDNGASESKNDTRVLIGGVAACVTNEDKIPFGCVLVDSNGDSVGVTLYNVSDKCNFNIGDVLTIINPTINHINLTELNVEYDCIKITQPEKHLLCNGRPLTGDKLSSPVAQVTAFS